MPKKAWANLTQKLYQHGKRTPNLLLPSQCHHTQPPVLLGQVASEVAKEKLRDLLKNLLVRFLKKPLLESAFSNEGAV